MLTPTTASLLLLLLLLRSSLRGAYIKRTDADSARCGAYHLPCYDTVVAAVVGSPVGDGGLDARLASGCVAAARLRRDADVDRRPAAAVAVNPRTGVFSDRRGIRQRCRRPMLDQMW